MLTALKRSGANNQEINWSLGRFVLPTVRGTMEGKALELNGEDGGGHERVLLSYYAAWSETRNYPIAS